MNTITALLQSDHVPFEVMALSVGLCFGGALVSMAYDAWKKARRR